MEIELALVPNSSKVKIIQLVLVPNSRKTQIFRLVFHLDSASSSYLASWNSTSWKFTTLLLASTTDWRAALLVESLLYRPIFSSVFLSVLIRTKTQTETLRTHPEIIRNIGLSYLKIKTYRFRFIAVCIFGFGLRFGFWLCLWFFE